MPKILTRLFALDCDSFKIAIAIFENRKLVGNVLIFGGKEFDADTRARNIYQDFCKFLDESKPDEVVIERSVYTQNFVSSRTISEVIGFCKLACGQRGILFSLVHNTSWKKYICKGNASKSEIRKVILKKFPELSNSDQDSIDSVGIGLYYLKG